MNVEQQTVYIKGMVCRRCLMTVKTELQELGHTPLHLSLGEVSFISNKTYSHSTLAKRLSLLGFSLLEDKKEKILKGVKQLVEEVYSGNYDFPIRFRFSDLIQKQLQKDYDTISDVFIATEKKTIEQYIIEFRINKVKELLVYTSQPLADIAFSLNFSSVAHLSAQFKQQTGLTPSFFREIRKQKTAAAFSKN